jgi:hypothetical protein
VSKALTTLVIVQLRNLLFRLFCVSCIFVLGGCSMALKNINDQSTIIGTEYKVIDKLFLYALSSDKYAKEVVVENYAIVSPPGLGHAERVSKA